MENNRLETSECLASLALFRELYDDKKRDIFGILSDFIIDTIVANGKYEFSLANIRQLLNDTYFFNIPEPIIKTTLKRLNLNKDELSGLYVVKDRVLLANRSGLSEKRLETKTNNELIINSLYAYIEEKEGKKINNVDRERIVKSFCSYLLDEDNNQEEFYSLISAFIIENKKDISFTKSLKIIKEGVVLYSGMRYNPSLDNLGSWNTDLNIYLETEILFSLAGYNGEVYRGLFNDFYSLVSEINNNSQNKYGKNLIKLKYFKGTKEEIDSYFNKAENIVSGKAIADPSKSAMANIIDGCRTPSDVIVKNEQFYVLLRNHGISLDENKEYYKEQNKKYNIEDIEEFKEIKKIISDSGEEVNEENIKDKLSHLNYINILRKGDSNKSFENIGYILLTSNRLFWEITKYEAKDGGVPLSTSFNFLTERFWFRLGKGFGSSVYPKSFDIITKAQIALSNQIRNSLSEKYEELKVQFREGKISRPEAEIIISRLRSSFKNPEDLDVEDIPEALSIIKTEKIDDLIREQEATKVNLKNKNSECVRLKEEKDISDREGKAKDEKIEKLNSELIFYKNRDTRGEEIIYKVSLGIITIIFLSISILIFLKLDKLAGLVAFIIGLFPNFIPQVRKKIKDMVRTFLYYPKP